MGYQDNLFLKECVKKEIETVYLASTECFEKGKIVDITPENRIQKDNVHLIRLPYIKIGPSFVYKKLRIIKNVYNILETENPDVIYCHNAHYTPVLDVVRYKKKHPNVKVYADTHVNEFNSASSLFSKIVLHKIYYRSMIKRLIPYLERFYYISPPCGKFLKKMYGVPDTIMEFLPLGGKVVVDEVIRQKRTEARRKYGIGENELLLVHSGKMDKLKRTDELIKSFSAVRELNAKMLLVGSIPDDRKNLLEELIDDDDRIKYIGWKTADELFDILCAADLYCQPGSPSATLQQAICCGCATMAYPYELYKLISKDNIVWVENSSDMIEVFKKLIQDVLFLKKLKNNSISCRKEYLDYSSQVERFIKQ